MSWRELEPRASRLWIRFAPKRWPASKRAHLDLAECRIVWPSAVSDTHAALPAASATGDVVVLPPLEKARSREKQDVATALLSQGCAVLDQRTVDGEPVAEGDGVPPVEDLLFPLLENNLALLDSVSPQGIVLVPLVPGLSSEESKWNELLAHLATRAPLAVVGVAPELSPLDRRRLVERLGDQSFERVHHHDVAAVELERRFARAVVAAGLHPLLERPAARLAPRAARNRRIAAALFEAGERWLALGRAEGDGASLLAAARHVDSATQDIEALARERQLAHLPFLSALARRAIEDQAESGRSVLVEELRRDWLAAEVPV